MGSCVQNRTQAEDVNLLVECLPSKVEGPEFNSQQHKTWMEAHTCDPSTHEVKARGSGVQGL